MEELGNEAVAENPCWRGLAALTPTLRSFLERRCRGSVEVDDVIQETLLRAARYRGTLADPERLCGWTLRIAQNALRDLLQRELRLPRAETTDDELESVPGREPAPGRDDCEDLVGLGAVALPRAEAMELLEHSLERLSRDDASVLRSYYSAPVLSCRGSAQSLRVRPEVFKMRLFRARRRLILQIEGQLTPAGGA